MNFDPPNPAANGMMPLMLFSPTGRSQVVGVAMPDTEGGSRISGLYPGNYVLKGADTRFFGLVPEDALLKNATRVTVRPSEATLVNIKVTTAR